MTSVAFHVDQLFYPAPGGIGTYIRELVPALLEADPGLEVTLFHSRLLLSPNLGWTLEDLPVERLPGSIRRLYPGWNVFARPALPEALARLDIVHAPSPAAIPPPGPGQRLVVTVHDLAFRVYPSLFPTSWRVLFRLGTRRAVRRADAIITVSQSTADDLVRYARADPARIHVVPLAASLLATEVDVDESLERMKVRAPYVLFVGTIEPRKNLVRLIRAYRRATARAGLPHRLVLAGPLGWRPAPLLREIAVDGPGEILLTGKRTLEELDALYRGAAAFAYPSLYEGFGLPVLEAMARGLPCVVSNTSSLPEVAGDAALVVEPRSISGLATAIERVLTDEGERARLSTAARARAGQFSWEQTARATLKVYESLP
ncbi:MAG TPA: glycosyltransferase family 1 protein [Actinomycetota bacterium]|nr:glycosyltransferase family 1 protein [Actinomycetota bacterium]